MKAKDLKNSILQMAVEGKLVPQDPNDEPASVLLERIRVEKQRLIAEGKAKFPKGGESIIYTGSDGSPYEKRVDAKGRVLSDECIADEVPFTELPEGWAWARLETALVNRDSERIPVSVADRERLAKIYDYYGASGVIDKVDHYLFDKTLLLIGEDGANLLMRSKPIAFLARGKYWVNNHAHVLDGINERYLEYIALFINSISLAPYVTGTAQPKMNQAKMGSILIPIPPESEQTRILAKVNELMPLVEEYGKLEDAREALDAALPDRLRKSVLQMAVQGKLVPQDPADEPASVLLEHIREQRRELVAEKKMKAPKGGESVIFRGSDGRRYEKRMDAKGRESEPICIEDEIPFEIPDSWEWVRLSTVLRLSSGLGYKKDNLSVKGEHMVRVLRGGNIGEDDEPLIKDNDVLISAEFVDDSLLLRDGQIITPAVTSLENVGKAAIVRNADGETVCGGFVFYLTPYLKSICHSEYLHRYLASPGHIAFCKSVVKKSGQAFYNLSKASLNSALIAIPPLAEQHRIVDRVNELMPLITNQ